VGTVWRTWFLGDLSGALVFAPLLLCWVGVRIDAIARRQALEGVAITALIVVLALLPSKRDMPDIVFPVPDDALAASWGETAAERKTDILEHGVDKRGMLKQHYATDSLDASALLAGMFGFQPGDDRVLRASVLAIADELTENRFVLRYRTDETDDGLSGKEGMFVICSFWLVSALAIIGGLQRARDLMQRLVKIASPLGLYAEEYDVESRRHLGNFPQAFSHLAGGRGRRPDHPRGAASGDHGVTSTSYVADWGQQIENNAEPA
jgi:hypothetical protein